MKAAVVLLSTFAEVLFLDADQVPVRDVNSLFRSAEYQQFGALLWPDFWDATWAPDAAKLLGVHEDSLPKHSHESGQMLFDKARCVPVPVFVPATNQWPEMPDTCSIYRPGFPDN